MTGQGRQTAAHGYHRRLAALAEAWGAANHFHLGVPERSEFWEEALKHAFGMVGAQDSERTYPRAVAWLLRRLDDPATGLVAADPGAGPHVPADPLSDLGDGVFLLSAAGGHVPGRRSAGRPRAGRQRARIRARPGVALRRTGPPGARRA